MESANVALFAFQFGRVDAMSVLLRFVGTVKGRVKSGRDRSYRRDCLRAVAKVEGEGSDELSAHGSQEDFEDFIGMAGLLVVW